MTRPLRRIATLAVALAAWPALARAQQPAPPPAIETFVQAPMIVPTPACAGVVGGRFVASDAVGHVLLWDVPSRRLVRRLEAGSRVGLLASTADGSGAYGTTAADPKQIVRFDFAAGGVAARLPPLPAIVRALHVAGDRFLAAGCSDGSVHVLDPRTGATLTSATLSASPIVCVGAGAGEANLTVVDEAGIIKACDTRDWRVVVRARVGHPLLAADVAPDGRHVVAREAPHGDLSVWDLQGGRESEADDRGRPVRVVEKALALRDLPLRARQAVFTGDSRLIAVHTITFLSLTKLDGEVEYSLGGREPFIFARTEGSPVIVGIDRGGRLAAYDTSEREIHRALLFAHSSSGVAHAVLSADARLAVIASYRRELRAFDVGELRGTWTLPAKEPKDAEDYLMRWRTALSPDGATVALARPDGTLEVVEAATGRELYKERLETDSDCEDLVEPAFSRDGRTLALVRQHAMSGPEKIVVLRRAAGPWRPTGTAVTLEESGDLLDAVAISPDLRLVAAPLRRKGAGDDPRKGGVRVWDSETGKVVARLEGHASWVGHARFSPDGKTLATTDATRAVRTFEVASWRPLETLAFPNAPAADAGRWMDLAPLALGGGRIARGSATGEICVWEADRRPRLLKGHLAAIAALEMSADGRYLLSGSNDSTARLWRLDVEPPASVNLVTTSEDWAVFAEDGLFDGSRGAGSFVTAAQGLRPFGIDQHALRLNRPDVLLERMGLGDAELREALAAEAARRLRRAGLTEASLEGTLRMPEVESRVERTGWRGARVHAKLADAEAGLRSWSAYVNDVPLFGAAGRPVTGASASVTADVDLCLGWNKIEVSCTNAAGAESLRSSVEIEGGTRPDGIQVFVLAFGVSAYRKPGLALKYAHKDALDLVAALKRLDGAHYHEAHARAEVHARAYTDAEVTVDAIRKAKSFLATARVDDMVVVFVAGHGMHDATADGRYYYLTADADPANLAGTAAPFELIEDLLQGIVPRKKLFLLDTCESGELDDGERGALYAAATSRGISARGFAKELSTGKSSGATRRQLSRTRDRFIDNDLIRRSGSIVFSSSRGGELSYESATIKNGFFTHEILEALKGAADANADGMVSVDELRAHVAAAVAKATGDAQHPTVDRDNIWARFAFPVVR